MFCFNKQLKTQIITLIRLVSIILITMYLPRLCIDRIAKKYKIHAQVKKSNALQFSKKHKALFLLATSKMRNHVSDRS